MIAPQTSIANRPHRITLSNPGAAVPDPDGGYTIGMAPLDPPQMSARIQPATAADLERSFSGTVIATATHVVSLPYHPGVTLQTVIEYVDEGGTHVYNVIGRANLEERDCELVLLCAEQVP